jgi:MFS family permease
VSGAREQVRSKARYGRLPLVMLAMTVAVESGERQSLAQAVDSLKDHFHLSNAAIGFLPTAMAVVGILGAVPFGHLADRHRRTWLLGGAMALWTLAMGLHGLATGYAFLFVTRMMVGTVEANGPAAISLISDYYPARERAKYMGLYQGGAFVGAVIGLVLGGVAVDHGGWRWAFWMWIPVGLLAFGFCLVAREPRRGERDEEFARHDDEALEEAQGRLHLPPPPRVGTLDYTTASTRQVYRELLRVRTMWLGLVALIVSSFLLNALQFWGVEYFKKVHHLDGAGAGAVTSLLGIGAVFGILGGGALADRYVRRGYVNARIWVIAGGSVAGGLILMPAFASTNLVVTAPLFFLGGMFLTLPIAPGEAIVSDVIVGELRGRAAALRSILRSVASVGPYVVGVLADAVGLRWALVVVCPTYVVGGLLVLLAARTYPADLAFVAAESRRRGV